MYLHPAPPPPIVNVVESVSGDKIVGFILNLTCTATTTVPNLVTPPFVNWRDITDTSITNVGGVLTFDPLMTSHGGEYTCESDYNIPDAGLTAQPATESIIISVKSESY